MHKESQLAADINRAKALREELRSLDANIERRLTRKPLTRADESAMTDMQVRADAVYQALGRRAPPPLPYEYPEEFRIRLIEGLRPHSTSWHGVSLENLPGTALDQIEAQIFDEARADARCPSDLKPNEIRSLVRQDSGRMVTDFVGRGHFVDQFRRPTFRVIFKSAEEYRQIARDNQASRNAQIMREHVELVRQGKIPSGLMPVPSTDNPIVEAAKAVTRRVRRSGT